MILALIEQTENILQDNFHRKHSDPGIENCLNSHHSLVATDWVKIIIVLLFRISDYSLPTEQWISFVNSLLCPMVSLGKYELLERITLDQPFVSGGEERRGTVPAWASWWWREEAVDWVQVWRVAQSVTGQLVLVSSWQMSSQAQTFILGNSVRKTLSNEQPAVK